MTNLVDGQLLSAAEWNALFAQYLPLGRVSSLSQVLLTKTSSAAFMAALGYPSAAPAAANGVAVLDGSGLIPVANIPPSVSFLNSPIFTGNPTAPTPSPGDNTNSLSTTAFVTAAITALIAGAPSTLNTLAELASAINNDPAFATTVSNALSLKAPLASPVLTGVPTAPTASLGTSTNQIATMAAIAAAISALGTASTKNTGTAAGQIPILDGSARLPAVDGSQVTNVLAIWAPGALNGLNMSVASTTTLTVAKGGARNEDGGTGYNMVMASAMTKSLSSWVAGNNNGGLDTGSIAASTWYHVHMILPTGGGTPDILFSLSPTAPTMPSGYTSRRRIGSFRTNSSSQITNFKQWGNRFIWETPPMDVNASNPGAGAAVTYTLTVPTGLQVQAINYVRLDYIQLSVSVFGIISDLSMADITPTVTIYNVRSSSSGNTGDQFQGHPVYTMTNTSGQLRYHQNLASSNVVLYMLTLGWDDARGQF